MRLLHAFALLLVLCLPAFAVNPDEVLADPALEARARELSAELRCLVCQNQSIDDSDADLARDLRVIVRERLVAGDSDAEVKDHIVSRYGEFVLLRPVIAPHTLFLWAAGPIILAAGLIGLWLAARRQPPEPRSLTREEEAAIEALQSGYDQVEGSKSSGRNETP
ncbi:cytochrome c-type biogenesis protein [Devosia nitrariae]|uniref:Cytochrome c-type biogenesis protein n=1 Tax=Devosia nitrariae TaxID=2071872 RepID=A0ABQ5W5K2_9HYPH|nr:cytochrome c-type biogenesis protein [Devosia nitrariae]GLQ55064.1 cytochrome c-type biogenesis protein CcmH [Devosia nitrariae]